jgi:acyl-CoA synthetase (AMP-forming)/AMP-acid ligase II
VNVLDQAGSVTDVLVMRARSSPHLTPLVADGRAWSYRELYEGAAAVATGLEARGVGDGDRVVIALPNGIEFFFAFFGVLLAGAVAVPAFPSADGRRLARLAQLAGATTIVTESGRRPNLDQRAAATVSHLWREPTRPVLATADRDQLCYVQYTSGSTGEPRGVRLTHGCLLTNIAQMVHAMDITDRDVFVSWLPTYHDMGLTLMAMTPLCLAARSVLLPTALRDVAPWLQAIETHHGTFTAGPDFAYRLCLRGNVDADAFNLSSLRVAMNASEPVRASTIARFEQRFGLGPVMMAGYGLAEETLYVACTRRGEPITVERGFVCLGSPVPGVDIVIVDDAERVVPNNVSGHIMVRSPAACLGYHDDTVATTALQWRDGYLRTGDLGFLDASGGLYFVARDKDTVNIAGRTIAPQEVEEIADSVSGVRLSAGIGVDEGGIEGEQLLVFIETRDSDDAALHAVAIGVTHELHRALGVRPRRVVVLRTGSIPRTENGKIQRNRLRELHLADDFNRRQRVLFPSATAPR